MVKNLGDYLATIVLDALGYRGVNRGYPDPQVINPGRCLLAIGSVLCNYTFEQISEPVDVWGCGWRGTPLPPEVINRVRFCAVRGPLTAAGLGLPPDIPLGDPALLLPQLCPRPVARHGKTVVVPHFYRTRAQSAGQRRQQSGCQAVLSTMIFQPQGVGQPGWLRQLLGLVRTWVGMGIQPRTVWPAVECLAGADFILTGSLHGAILAQAYGVPWAAYDDGYVDAPPKWQDWAAYLGVDLEFAANLAEGERWWARSGCHGVVRDLAPLLAAFPYPAIPQGGYL